MEITRRRSLGTIVLAGALAFGGALAASVPAQAAGSGTASVSPVQARASTTTSGGTQGRSYAQHGCASSLSGWASASTWAKASCGLSSGQAWYQFR
ncbi:hypothetical protein [Frigoribacterium sp. VKM Ac-2836]|uniref:hypothetical protein n=1 Tax=Frigoribacterium sp. VKM Ac-2836 TaxID=2739014 RepID=UPI001564D35B|nr:hypothetical protein [Frigoribacterium sp. VKM Ac-2836]NRD27222.1 hypothetical protein [Frigoribacterium sp. VKM Ac-2836]